MGNTKGLTNTEVSVLIKLADDWLYHWTIIRADIVLSNGDILFRAFSREPVFSVEKGVWGLWSKELMRGTWPVDVATFRIDNPRLIPHPCP